MKQPTNNKRGRPVPEAEILRQIWDEIRYVRKRLDDHVDDEDNAVESLRSDISGVKDELTGVKEEISAHRVKIGLMLAGLTLAVTGIISWLANYMSNTS